MARQLNDQEIATIVRLRKMCSWSIQSIAKHIGCSDHAVRCVLRKKAGYVSPPAKQNHIPTPQQIQNRIAEIQAGWDLETHNIRQGHPRERYQTKRLFKLTDKAVFMPLGG